MIDRFGILENSPLVYAVASVRFTPWLLMAKKIDEIHDELRETAPIIHRIQVQQIEANPRSKVPGEAVMTSSVWLLLSSDRSLWIHLAADQLLIVSKKYSRYSEFEVVVDKCLDVLLRHMRSIMDVTSLGVRYVDHIKPHQDEAAIDYVTAHLLPADLSGFQATGGMFLGTYKADDAELRVRCVTQPDSLTVPEDIITLLAMSQEPSIPLHLETLGNGILLDIDAVKAYATPVRMAKESVVNQLDALHKEANTFFRHGSVCTEHAFAVWKGGD